MGVRLSSKTRSPGPRSSSNTRPLRSGGTITRTTGSSSSRSWPISPAGLPIEQSPAHLLRGHHELDRFLPPMAKRTVWFPALLSDAEQGAGVLVEDGAGGVRVDLGVVDVIDRADK